MKNRNASRSDRSGFSTRGTLLRARIRSMSAAIRECRDDEHEAILAIVNAAPEAYRGVIPADRWHEPYMTRAELEAEMDRGVAFSGCEADGRLAGVMGLEPVRDVTLIRHAYVLPEAQG